MESRHGNQNQRGTRPRRPRYIPRRRVCAFCVDKVDFIDYKDSALLGKYMSDRGRIAPRRKTGTCPKHQRALATSLKRARYIALLPYTAAHVQQVGGMGRRGA